MVEHVLSSVHEALGSISVSQRGGKSMIADAEIPSINYVGNAEEKSLHN